MTDGSFTDQQRTALGDLIDLASRRAQTAGQIEQRHRSQVAQIERDFKDSTQQIEATFASAQAAAQDAYDQRVQDARRQFDEQHHQAQEQFTLAHENMVDDAEKNEQHAQETLTQTIWLAESVFDAGQDELRKQFETVRGEVEEHLEALRSIENDATALLRDYGQEPMAAPITHKSDSGASDPLKAMRKHRETAEAQLELLRALSVPKWFKRAQWYASAVLLLVALGALAFAVVGGGLIYWIVTVTAAVLSGFTLIWLAVNTGASAQQVRAVYGPLHHAVATARGQADRAVRLAAEHRKRKQPGLVEKRDRDIAAVKQRYEPMLARLPQRHTSGVKELETSHTERLVALQDERDLQLRQAEQTRSRRLEALRKTHASDLAEAQQRHDEQLRQCNEQVARDRADLAQRWDEGVARAHEVIDHTTQFTARLFADWNDPCWQQWTAPDALTPAISFGQLTLDMRRIGQGDETSKGPQEGDGAAANTGTSAPATTTELLPSPMSSISPPASPSPSLPPADAMLSVPALLSFPDQCSLLVQTGRNGRDEAIDLLQVVMLRLLTALPPGRVRFTIVDPVGRGQSFAGFMHLADYEEALVGGRIWTESEHISRRLTDLTEHMENVIQKYLRNEYDTIDQYNAQAGELAEPYRFLVIADFPSNFNEDSARRLASIVSSGSRCGVYTLIAADTRQSMPHGVDMADIESHSVNIVRRKDGFVWKDAVFGRFDLSLDAPPPAEFLQDLLNRIGQSAKDSTRVQVPFASIAPPPGKAWTADSSEEIRVPIGRSGATRAQHLALGKGVAQHALIAGKTGSGKSTLLHVLITNLSLWYGCDQVEFYLVDFKKGVEFKTYATHDLPHAQAVAIESDREFGLSVLQRLDAEMRRRGDLFRDLGVQDVAAYRKAPRPAAASSDHGTARTMPRILLVIDEFQEFFSEDDKLAQDAALLLDRLVRQGRAFGIHVVLGTQTLAGAYGLARSTIGQMAVRIALQCSEADSQLILGDNNAAARLLSRPGEAIYNDAGGLVEGNSPFQITWLPDEQRERYLNDVSRLVKERGFKRSRPQIVFEGNAAADLAKNALLAAHLEAPAWGPPPVAPTAWLGDPIAIKDPTGVAFRRQNGSNMLIVGQRDEAATAMTAAALVSLAAQLAPEAVRFCVFDGTPADSPLTGVLQRVADALPHDVQFVPWRNVPEAMADLAGELQRRLADDESNSPPVFLVVHGLQRYRVLAASEDDFSFSSDDEPKPAKPDKQFAELLREGPPLGMHVLTWCDAPTTLNRMLDRQSLRQFDARVLFQMSATDSSQLIDSPIAGKLGLRRALFYSEEQGLMEKFRPYTPPPAHWLEHVKARLRSKAAVAKPDRDAV